MDRSTFRFAFLCYLALAGCQQKTAETVFTDVSPSLACAGSALSTQFIVHYTDGRHSVERARSKEDFKNTFVTQNLSRIESVEADRKFQFLSEPSQIASDSTGSSNQWGLDMINVESAWAKGFYGQNVKVAVLDSEVEVTHPQLRERILINTAEIPGNGIDDDHNGVIDDYAGAVFISSPGNSDSELSDHGTHVSGIIAADPTKGSVKGVASQAKILPVQFLARTGEGYLSDALKALNYAEQNNVDIINASWGGSPCVKSMKDAMNRLSQKGVLIVVASGNRGQDLDRAPEFPAAFNVSNQITVAASTDLDFMTSWSNSSFNLVHVAAPGDQILSTVTGNRIGLMSGTSMATPFVSGVAALLKSAYPKATGAQIKNAIMNSVDVNPGHEFRVQSHGRVNVEKALQSLRSVSQ